MPVFSEDNSSGNLTGGGTSVKRRQALGYGRGLHDRVECPTETGVASSSFDKRKKIFVLNG